MKYLSNYVEKKQTALFDSMGAFFAFSDSQFDEAKVEGVKYVSLFAGMICPKENARELIDRLETIHKDGIAEDLAENGVQGVIHRELGNHEAQITGDIDSTVDALEGYGISRLQIQNEYGAYYKECVKNDWF